MNFIRTKKRAIAGALAVLFAVPAFAGIPKMDKSGNYETTVNKMDADPFFKKSLEEEIPATIKIYNYNDELVYECERKRGDAPDVRLIKLLNKSDYLTTNDKISYFRLND